MVQYLDHVEILGSNAISHDLYISNGISQQANMTEDKVYQNGYVHNSFNFTNNSSFPSPKSHDVEMNCDEVQGTTDKTNSGNHYLNQPVRCLNLCGHLQ